MHEGNTLHHLKWFRIIQTASQIIQYPSIHVQVLITGLMISSGTLKPSDVTTEAQKTPIKYIEPVQVINRRVKTFKTDQLSPICLKYWLIHSCYLLWLKVYLVYQFMVETKINKHDTNFTRIYNCVQSNITKRIQMS